MSRTTYLKLACLRSGLAPLKFETSSLTSKWDLVNKGLNSSVLSEKLFVVRRGVKDTRFDFSASSKSFLWLFSKILMYFLFFFRDLILLYRMLFLSIIP